MRQTIPQTEVAQVAPQETLSAMAQTTAPPPPPAESSPIATPSDMTSTPLAQEATSTTPLSEITPTLLPPEMALATPSSDNSLTLPPPEITPGMTPLSSPTPPGEPVENKTAPTPKTVRFSSPGPAEFQLAWRGKWAKAKQSGDLGKANFSDRNFRDLTLSMETYRKNWRMRLTWENSHFSFKTKDGTHRRNLNNLTFQLGKEKFFVMPALRQIPFFRKDDTHIGIAQINILSILLGHWDKRPWAGGLRVS